MKPRSWLLGLPAGLVLGCALPDLDIVIQSEENEHSVRIVQRLPVSDAADAACDEVLRANGGNDDAVPCPLIPEPLPTGLLDPSDPGRQFCSCPSDQSDDNALGSFSVYAEDDDADVVDGKIVPKDTLFAAFLLDVEEGSVEAPDAIAYRSYLQPDSPGLVREDLAYTRTATKVGRAPPLLREFRIGSGSLEPLDLCNDSGQGVGALSRGFHELIVVVTDRPWFTPGDDEDRLPREDGVPDIAAGATYDEASWVFFCNDINEDQDNPYECSDQCQAPEEEG